MQLKDFYFADIHAVGSRMPILLPNGKESGEWLQVIGPDCDEAIQAGRAYTAAVRRIDDELIDLEKACEAKENYAEWNEQRAYRLEVHNRILALSVVNGWSFDEEFTKEELNELFCQYRGLSEAVLKYHTDSRAKLLEK